MSDTCNESQNGDQFTSERLLTFSGEGEPVPPQHLSAFQAGHEGQKGLGVFQPRRPRDDSRGLADGVVQRGWNEPVPPIGLDRRCYCERERDNPDIGIPGAGELQSLADILAEHKFCMHPVPQPAGPEGLRGCSAIGGMLGVGDGDEPNTIVGEYVKSPPGIDWRVIAYPEDDPPNAVNLLCLLGDETLRAEVANQLLVCREEDATTTSPPCAPRTAGAVNTRSMATATIRFKVPASR